MKATVNPILTDHLTRLNRQFIKEMWQTKNFFSVFGSRCSGYKNTICDQYVKQIEKIGQCIFTYLTPEEKLTHNLFNQVFSHIYSELKGRLIIDLDGNCNTMIVDQAYQRIMNHFLYKISLSQKRQVKSEVERKALKIVRSNSFAQRKENVQNREEILENDPKNLTTNITLNNCNICCNENTTGTKVSQNNKKIINPKPENIICLLLKKMWSYFLNLF